MYMMPQTKNITFKMDIEAGFANYSFWIITYPNSDMIWWFVRDLKYHAI